MKALVHRLAGEVTQIVADDATFEVHGDLVWKDFDTTAVSYDAAVDNPPEFEYNTETEEITRKVFEPLPYDIQRKFAYNPLEEQLDQLWHDIDDGKLGDAAKTGVWYNGVKSTKDAYPKG